MDNNLKQTLTKFRQAYDGRLENGSLVPNKSAFAENIAPVSQDSGDTQEIPFINQGTGTGNGTASVDTGSTAQQLLKQGSVYCVNQQHYNGNGSDFGTTYTQYTKGWFANTSYSTASITNGKLRLSCVNSNYITFDCREYGGNSVQKALQGHKYLLIFKCYLSLQNTSKNVSLLMKIENTYHNKILNANSNVIAYDILEAPEQGTKGFNVQIGDSGFGNFATGDYLDIDYYEIIDLTQWFNGDIPQDVLDNPENFARYHNYGDYIAYNTGTLVSGNGRYLTTTGRNQFNKETVELNKYVNHDNGMLANSNGFVATDFIEIIPNSQLYLSIIGTSDYSEWGACYDKDKNFISSFDMRVNGISSTQNIVPSNARYIRVSIPKPYYEQTTISLYYSPEEGGEGYSDYYPYQEPKTYDTGTETLLSTGVKYDAYGVRIDVHDSKLPSGEITRRVGSYTFTGSETWIEYGGGYRTVVLSDSKYKAIGGAVIPTNVNTDCGLPLNTRNSIADGNSGISLNEDTIIVSSTTGLTGKTIIYELATPTTEQGTAFPENIEINDYGTMSWDTQYVPQGCEIFYPAWYAGFIDSLGGRADWKAGNIALNGELSNTDPQTLKAVITYLESLHNIEQENIGGALRHQLVANVVAGGGTLDFANTAWVDLGTLTFSSSTSAGHTYYFATLTGVKQYSADSKPNIICPLYKTVLSKQTAYGILNTFNEDMIISVLSSSETIIIRNDNLTNTDNLKGIILTYEKAS